MLNKDIKKKLENSQNFLYNDKLVAQLIGKSNVEKGDIVIEIGPGKGIITKQLAKKCSKVYAIEYDPYLCSKLNKLFYNIENVEIRHGDFLEFMLPEKQKYKVFSSIPYNITSAILSKLTSFSNPPEDAYLIVQEEAAKKYAGSPYNKESMRSLLLKPYFDLKIMYKLKRTDFKPVPSVNSVLLHISKRKKALINKNQADLYWDFIAYIFKRNGNMRDRCKHIFSYKQLKRLSKDVGFSMTDCPAYINFQQWLKVFQYYIIGVADEKKRLVCGSYSRLQDEQKKIDKIHRSRK